ncbi:SMC-Scp complex subunit ScpB [Oenococcus alcoholitolerans]|uniref:SMC-Scp complex subunit ScpB n=1 Tax=Oenococcus alcoholitolerans TaxID=931074 RepID=UPI003F711D73
MQLDKTAVIFSLIFVSGDQGIDIDSLSAASSFDRSAVYSLIDSIAKKLKDEPKIPLELKNNGGIYRFTTKIEFADVLEKYYQQSVSSKLSKASLETLTVVAYKQPVTRIEIDKIRGVNSSGAISRLLANDLIEEAGRKNVIGRPVLYKTTDFFLNYFDLKDLNDLPDLPDIKIDEEDLSGSDIFKNNFEGNND